MDWEQLHKGEWVGLARAVVQKPSDTLATYRAKEADKQFSMISSVVNPMRPTDFDSKAHLVERDVWWEKTDRWVKPDLFLVSVVCEW